MVGLIPYQLKKHSLISQRSLRWWKYFRIKSNNTARMHIEAEHFSVTASVLVLSSQMRTKYKAGQTFSNFHRNDEIKKIFWSTPVLSNSWSNTQCSHFDLYCFQQLQQKHQQTGHHRDWLHTEYIYMQSAVLVTDGNWSFVCGVVCHYASFEH